MEEKTVSRTTDELMRTAFLWRATLADGQAAPEERRRFEAWLRADPAHARAYERARRFWDEMGALDREALDPAFFRPSPGERLRRALAPGGHRAAWAGGLAAVCLVALLALHALPGWFPGAGAPSGAAGPQPAQGRTYAAAVGETRSLELADGSRVTLGADTAVEVVFDPGLRLVRMGLGEAYFEVAPDADRPFEVVAGQARITVHGTAFNVRRGAGDTHVAVAEGVVSVLVPGAGQGAPEAGAGGARAETLAAGERLTVRADGGAVKDASPRPEAIGAWRDRLLVYIDTPLADITADLNRYRHRKIRIADQDLAGLRVTATFDSGDIEGLLQTLTEVFPVRLEAIGDETVLRRAP